MAKSANDLIMDAALGVVDDGTIITVCSAQPTTRTEAVTTYALADGVPSYSAIANGDTSGRKITHQQVADITIDTSGTATHVATSDATNLLVVTTCTSQALTAGGTVTIPAWDYEIADPT